MSTIGDTTDSQDIVRTLRAIRPELQAMNVSRLRVFGSVGRGEAGPDSDVDLIVDFTQVPDLIEFIRIRNTIANRLGRAVDMATERALHPLIKDDVVREARDVWS